MLLSDSIRSIHLDILLRIRDVLTSHDMPFHETANYFKNFFKEFFLTF